MDGTGYNAEGDDDDDTEDDSDSCPCDPFFVWFAIDEDCAYLVGTIFLESWHSLVASMVKIGWLVFGI